MTKEKIENIVRGITDKIESATVDIDDWAEFWGFTREDYEEFLEMPIKSLEQEPCEDAVSREAVLKEIPRLWNSKCDKDYCMETLRDFVSEMPPVKPVACIAKITFSKEDMQKLVNEKIKEITAEPEERWIPCSERLPKESGFYLVSTTDCITIMEFCKGWISQNIGSCNWYVKAWQQLLKPYREV